MESKFTFNSTTRYIYHCNTCQHNLICYSDERLEKEQRPTPFTATCPYCKGTMYDSGIYQIEEKIKITEFDKNSDGNTAIFLLLDKDIKLYKDMACGCLHIRKNNKLIPTYAILLKVDSNENI